MLCRHNSTFIYTRICTMTLDLFYISRSLVVPSVDYMNMNKTKLYYTILQGSSDLKVPQTLVAICQTIYHNSP